MYSHVIQLIREGHMINLESKDFLGTAIEPTATVFTDIVVHSTTSTVISISKTREISSHKCLEIMIHLLISSVSI